MGILGEPSVVSRYTCSEAELAAVVVAWLETLGADVYQEVELPGGIADIVARVRAELWIIETKTSLSLKLVAQALDRRKHAHRVFIAAPYKRATDGARLCRELGIGLLDVRVDPPLPACYAQVDIYGRSAVQELAPSRRWNSRPVALAARLQPEHKTAQAAGSTGGGRWTPFRRTCEELQRIVRAEPGIQLKAAIDKMRHHYATPASARGSLATWIKKGKVPGVRLERGAATTLHPVELEKK